MERVIFDCSTGETTTVPLTEEEIAERSAAAQQAAGQAHQYHAALMEQRANDAKDHALILGKARTDPVFAALARQLGIGVED